MAETKLPKLPTGYKRVGVDLPPTVVAIIKAAGGEIDMPKAMAYIVGALPYISVALFKSLPESEYRAYAEGLTVNIEAAKRITNASDPVAAFDELVALAKRAVN